MLWPRGRSAFSITTGSLLSPVSLFIPNQVPVIHPGYLHTHRTPPKFCTHEIAHHDEEHELILAPRSI